MPGERYIYDPKGSISKDKGGRKRKKKNPTEDTADFKYRRVWFKFKVTSGPRQVLTSMGARNSIRTNHVLGLSDIERSKRGPICTHMERGDCVHWQWCSILWPEKLRGLAVYALEQEREREKDKRGSLATPRGRHCDKYSTVQKWRLSDRYRACPMYDQHQEQQTGDSQYSWTAAVCCTRRMAEYQVHGQTRGELMVKDRIHYRSLAA